MQLPSYRPGAVQPLANKTSPAAEVRAGGATTSGIVGLLQAGAEWMKAESQAETKRAQLQAETETKAYLNQLLNTQTISREDVIAQGVTVPKDLGDRDMIPTYRVMQDLYQKRMDEISSRIGETLAYDRSKEAFAGAFAQIQSDADIEVSKQFFDWRYSHLRGVGMATLDGMLETAGPENRNDVIANGQGVISDMVEQGALDFDDGLLRSQTWAGDVDFAIGMNTVFQGDEGAIEGEMDRVANRNTSMTAKQQGQFMRAADTALSRISKERDDAKTAAQEQNLIQKTYDVIAAEGTYSDEDIVAEARAGLLGKGAMSLLKYNRTIREAEEAEGRTVYTDQQVLSDLNNLVTEFRYGSSEIPNEQRRDQILAQIQAAMGYNELGEKVGPQQLAASDYNGLISRLNQAAEAPQQTPEYKATRASIRRLVAGVEGGMFTGVLGSDEKLRLDRALTALDRYMETAPDPNPVDWWRNAQDFYLDQETKATLRELGSDIAAGAIVLVNGEKAAFTAGEIDPGQARVDIAQSELNMKIALEDMLIGPIEFDAGMRALQQIDEKQRGLESQQ